MRTLQRLRGVTAVAAALGFGVVVIVLSLSDRAPRFVPRITDLVLFWGRRFEAAFSINLFDVSSIPGQTDQIGHAMLWGTGMFVLGIVTRRFVPVTATACLLLAASIGVEFAQETWTATRALQVTDALANGVGIGIAAIAVVTIGAVTDTIAKLWFALAGTARAATSMSR